MDVINIGLQEFVKDLSCLLSKLFAVSFSGIALDSTLTARNPQAFVFFQHHGEDASSGYILTKAPFCTTDETPDRTSLFPESCESIAFSRADKARLVSISTKIKNVLQECLPEHLLRAENEMLSVQNACSGNPIMHPQTRKTYARFTCLFSEK